MKRRLLALPVLLLVLLLTLLPASAAGTYETVIAEGLIEAYDTGRPFALDAAANWDADLDAILSLVCSVVPENVTLSVEGDTRFVTYTADDLVQSDTAALQTRAEEVLAALCPDGMSDREKVTAMHDWLVRNTTYREEGPVSHSPEGVLERGAAVCDGYARTMLLFCRMERIPCLFLASESMNHSYNAVWLEGEWLLLDATWDDPDQGGTVLDKHLLRPFSDLPDHTVDGAGLTREQLLEFGNTYYAFLIEEKGQPAALTQRQMADLLYEKGLFLGTDLGYELERTPTRAEAAVMFVRVLGREAEALAGEATHPFADVPEWAAPHIALLYRERLSLGQSDTSFGAASATGARDYATFLLRALGLAEGTDFAWETAMDTATARGFAPRGWDGTSFTRGDAVEMTARALGYVTGDALTPQAGGLPAAPEAGEAPDSPEGAGESSSDPAAPEETLPEGL